MQVEYTPRKGLAAVRKRVERAIRVDAKRHSKWNVALLHAHPCYYVVRVGPAPHRQHRSLQSIHSMQSQMKWVLHFFQYRSWMREVFWLRTKHISNPVLGAILIHDVFLLTGHQAVQGSVETPPAVFKAVDHVHQALDRPLQRHAARTRQTALKRPACERQHSTLHVIYSDGTQAPRL